jgi:uncharacterized phage protein (TIGR01671 family)
MRDLKFRAWDIELNKMWFDVRVGGFDVTVPTVYSHGRWVHLPDSENLMQYTGAKDINGVEVYEGDIIRYTEYNSSDADIPNQISTVVFDTGSFLPVSEGYCQHIEVIGNTYEIKEQSCH